MKSETVKAKAAKLFIASKLVMISELVMISDNIRLRADYISMGRYHSWITYHFHENTLVMFTSSRPLIVVVMC